MKLLRRWFGRRKSSHPPPKRVSASTQSTSQSRLSDRLSQNEDLSGADFQMLEDLREKCGRNTLNVAEAETLLAVSSKLGAPLTPREIVDLQRILSPQTPPASPKPADRNATASPESQRRVRTPTAHMLPTTQTESDLFYLPAEIRARIWAYAVGGCRIYLAVQNDKLVQQKDMQQPYWRHANGLLSVPLICRQAYLESINLLYSENTFGIGFGSIGSNKKFFTNMNTFLLPQCTAAMRSLEVGFHLSGGHSQYYESHPQAWDLSLEVPAPESLSDWISVFKSLARMKGLRRLVVVVWASGDRRDEFKARENELMDIPSVMTGLQKFEVWLPWKKDEGTRTEGRGAYVVRREFEDRRRFGVSVPKFSS
ncbi:hypothetical protein GGR57DRAFT_286876 [Xylariaceae sp. FL1272]|nr:hypothetical protein GGR57DRAFT_286876 [Xylariaceae sp. FL1272]